MPRKIIWWKWRFDKGQVQNSFLIKVINTKDGGFQSFHCKTFLNLYKNHDAVITDIPILKTLLLDCTIWSKDTTSWSIQLQILISLVREAHKYRAFNLRVLIEAETVLRLLETLQITLSDHPKLEITDSISDQLIELIRVLIGYPPDTKIISRVFDFCCGVHPPAQAYVTNTHHKECFSTPVYIRAPGPGIHWLQFSAPGRNGWKNLK